MTTTTPTHPPTPTNPPTFTLPPHTSFPPFYTLQPNPSTLSSQLTSWTTLLLTYSAHHSLFRLTPSHPIFSNPRINRTLKPADATRVLAALVERGRGEWVAEGPGPGSGGFRGFWGAGGAGVTQGYAGDERGEGAEIYVWFRTPEDWAQEIYKWVEDTGQKGGVLTLFELLDGGGGGGDADSSARDGLAFRGLPVEMAKRVVEGVLVKRGLAVVFGEGDGGRYGVKFF